MQHPDYPNIELKPALITYNLDQIYDLLVTNNLIFPVARYFSFPLTNHPTVIQRYACSQYHWCYQYADKLFDFAKYFNGCYYNDFDYEIQNIDGLYHYQMPVNFSYSNRYKKNESYNVSLEQGKYRFSWLVLITPFDNFLQYKYSTIVDQAFTFRNFEVDEIVDLNKIFKQHNYISDENLNWRCFCVNSLVISKYINDTWLDITNTLTYPKNFLAYSDIDEYFLEIKNTWENYVNAYSFYFNGYKYDQNYINYISGLGFTYLLDATQSEREVFFAKLKIPMPLGHYLAGLDCISEMVNEIEELTTIPVIAPIPDYIRNTISLVRANNNYWSLSLYPELPNLGIEINQGEFNFNAQELWYNYKNLPEPLTWQGIPPYVYQKKEIVAWGEALTNFRSTVETEVFNRFSSLINPATINFNTCQIQESFSVSWFREIQKYDYNGVNSDQTLWASLKRLSYSNSWEWETLHHSYSWRTTTDYFSGEVLPGSALIDSPDLRGVLYVPNKNKSQIIKHSFVPVNEIMFFSMGRGFWISSEHIMAKITGYLIYGVSDPEITRFEVDNIELLSSNWIDRLEVDDYGIPTLRHWDNLPYNGDITVEGREIPWNLEEWEGLLTFHKNSQRSPAEYYNFVKTTIINMSNSIKLEEIHAALGAGEYAHYIDDEGNSLPPYMHMARRLEHIGFALGIMFELSGAIRSLRQSKHIAQGNQIPPGWPIGQFGRNNGGQSNPLAQQGGDISQERLGLCYQVKSNRFITSANTGQDAITQGGYVLVENIPQLLHIILQDLDKSLGLQTLGAFALPNPNYVDPSIDNNPNNSGDLTEENNPEFLKFEGLGDIILELSQTVAQISQDSYESNLGILKTQAITQEILGALGVPVCEKWLKQDIGGETVEILYPGLNPQASTLADLLFNNMANLSLLMQTNVKLVTASS